MNQIKKQGLSYWSLRFLVCISLLTVILCLPMSAWAEQYTIVKEDLPPVTEGAWTVVVLPDLHAAYPGQSSSYKKNPEQMIPIQTSMFEWMAENNKERNLQMVLNVGDMSSNNVPESRESVRSYHELIDGVYDYILERTQLLLR